MARLLTMCLFSVLMHNAYSANKKCNRPFFFFLKCQVLFSLKNNKSENRSLSATIFFSTLTLNTLGRSFGRLHIEISFFFIFPRKQDLTFHANCLHWRKFAWKCEILLSGKNKKNTNFLSAEWAKRVVKIKVWLKASKIMNHVPNLFIFSLQNICFC